MRFVTVLVMLLTLSGCLGRDRVSTEALCQGTLQPRDSHTEALIRYGEGIIGIGAGEVLVTGQTLISSLDAGCLDKKIRGR